MHYTYPCDLTGGDCMFRIFKNLYAKLIASAAIGVFLVAGMIMNEQWNSASIERSSASSRNQNEVVKEVLLAQQEYLRGQIQRRNVVMAKTLTESEKALAELKTAGEAALAHAKSAAEHAVDPENRARLEQFTKKLGDFLSLSLAMSQTRFDLFKLHARESDMVVSWNKAIAAAMAFPALKDNADALPRLRDAASSMMDTRVAYWRYSTLQEPVILGRMYQAADKVYIELQRARGATTDKKGLEVVDGLIAIMTAMNDVIDGTKQAFDTYLKIDRERNNPLRAELEDLIEKISTTATEIAQDSEASVVADMRQSSRVGLGVGLFVVVVLFMSSIFSMVTFRRHAIASKAADERAAASRREAEERAAMEKKAADDRAAAEQRAAMRKLADEFEAAVGKIVDMVSTTSVELEAAAGTMSKTADTTQQLSSAVATASEDSSTNVQSVASATDEMATSIAEISRQVQESSGIAIEAVRQAERTDARIGELTQAASRIGAVIKLITAIAEQTNLLALNATIEAARAGEAGKGFAVVAQEVKQLASQTAKATDEIRAQIAGMQTATHESVGAIKEIGETIGRISQIATTVASAVEEQGAATQEIARNIQRAAGGTTQVATNIAEVTRGANETGAASAQMLVSAQSLANESSRLKLEVEKFLSTVRAA